MEGIQFDFSAQFDVKMIHIDFDATSFLNLLPIYYTMDVWALEEIQERDGGRGTTCRTSSGVQEGLISS